MCLDLGGALGQRAGQYMEVTSRDSGCHGTCRPLRVEGSLPSPFEQFLQQGRKYEHCGWKGWCLGAFSVEGFGCGQALVWRITRNRETMSLSFSSEGLEWKQRSVGKILCRVRTRDGGKGTVRWSLRDSGTPLRL